MTATLTEQRSRLRRLVGQIDLTSSCVAAPCSKRSPKPKRGGGAGEPSSSTGLDGQTSRSHAAVKPRCSSGKPAGHSKTPQGRWP